MDRRDFSKLSILMGAGAFTGIGSSCVGPEGRISEGIYTEPAKKLPAREFDVVVAGGGTAGVVAAIAAARNGAKTMLIEAKGYPGGTVTEGGTAIHSFYNLWKAFDGVEKLQVVRGIPSEIIDRLMLIGGCTGHAEMERGYNYDSVCTAIDTELYKLVTFEMLVEAGVHVSVNTLCAGAITSGTEVKGVIIENRSGRQAILAKSFIDCTAYGDLAAHAGAEFTVPNDYGSCSSIGVGNVGMDAYYKFLKSHDAVGQLARGKRSGKENQLIRLSGRRVNLPEEYAQEADAIGLTDTSTTVHDNYLMFIKINMKVEGTVINADDISKAELILRQRQYRGIELFKKFIPGCENAFIARTTPSLTIRRGRLVTCDYDITHEDVVEGRHFDDDIYVYGFHDMAPKFQIKDGGTYGVPYRAITVAGLDNMYVAGMIISSDHRAHMSTRNTVSSMAMGQGAGTAAALCAKNDCAARDLNYTELRDALDQAGVYFES
ncbi:FAD-dependent oxidoreductase [Bacteroidota bacterium]